MKKDYAANTTVAGQVTCRASIQKHFPYRHCRDEIQWYVDDSVTQAYTKLKQFHQPRNQLNHTAGRTPYFLQADLRVEGVIIYSQQDDQEEIHL